MSEALIESEATASPASADAPRPGHYETIVRNVASNWLWFGLVMISGLIIPRFIAQHQGKEMLGVWDLGWSLGFYVGIFSLGLTSAVTRFVAQCKALGDRESLDAVVNTGLVIMVTGSVLGAVSSLGLAALAPRLMENATPETVASASEVILVLAVAAALQFPGTVFGGVICGCERYDLHSILRSIMDGLLLVAMIVLLVSGCSLVTLAWAVLLIEIPSFTARMWMARRLCPELRLSPRFFCWSKARDMVQFSAKSALHAVSSSALYQLNGIMVSFFMGPAVLAVYSRQRVLVLQALRFIRQYAMVFIPSSSAMHATGDMPALRKLVLTTSLYGMYFTLPIVLLLLVMGGPLVDLWMRPGFAAPVVLAVMAVGHLLSVSQQGVYSILMGMASHGRAAMFDAAGAVLGILLALVFMGVLRMGMLGAALAMSIPVALMGGIAMPLYACRLVGLNFREYLREILVGPILANIPFALCLLAARHAYQGAPVYGLLMGMLIGGMVNVGIYWRWVLPSEIRGKVLERLGFGKLAEGSPA